MNPKFSLIRNLLTLLLLGSLPTLAQNEKPDAPETAEESEQAVDPC